MSERQGEIVLDQLGEERIWWEGDRDYHSKGMSEPMVAVQDGDEEIAIVNGVDLYFALGKLLRDKGVLPKNGRILDA